jgi:integrase
MTQRKQRSMQRGELLQAFVAYQQGRAFSGGTIRRRVSSLSSFLDFIHPSYAAEAGPTDVEEWLRGFKDPQTRYSYRSDLKIFYRWAVRRGIARDNPVDDTDPPRLPKRLPRPLQPADLSAALAAADGDVQLMMMLGAFAGLRVSEIARLATADLHMDRTPAVMLVKQGKGRKDRVVPLHPALVSRLRGTTVGYIFPSGTGHVHPGTVTRRVGNVLHMVGIEATAHCLRHTFGTELARVARGNLVAVAQVMGHESVNTTNGYVGWSPETADMVAQMYSG